ncbi:antitoxin Xre/MbcA/ParS toxin-binding domain-containing protein [Halomonas sp.]|uniref:antitoxin Xre/MbcA/ParS toxin-binding domain-containing protein n=1 Tax=Halomonas sp. TaxID=1486246 RepID=UPI00298D9CA4|nr:antitoxin Xre/MbcA/ParS toxin-binding domain-containing protein [Halomonas sp.]MDW7746684.1 antitoxin Xre/MbcA/ParS toxin-binding domain-containing protein [Halomonas sp.]
MTQPSHPPKDPLARIFAYRAIDLRDRFPQPLESFREALECLQSDRSYMAAMSGEIIAYLRGGYALTIPDEFFICRSGEIDATLVPPEENDAVCAKVEAWLREMLTRPDVDTTKAVPAEERPYSLDQLLAQCDLQAPPPEELQAWQDTPDVGREILEAPTERDIWQAAERLFESREGAERWMTSPEIALRSRTPADVMVEDPQQIYDLIMRLEYGVYT